MSDEYVHVRTFAHLLMIGNTVQNISSSTVRSRDKIARVYWYLATATAVFSLPKLTNQRYSSPPCCW